MTQVMEKIEIISNPKTQPESNIVDRILTREAKAFLAALNHEFNHRREALLAERQQRQVQINTGHLPDFPSETAEIRKSNWVVAPAPTDLLDRRVEITGPTDRKMMINALNSGAKVFMADFEDSLAPTWQNVIEGQDNLMEAVRGTLSLDTPEGKKYRLNDQIATLIVRPRGWHLVENHFRVNEAPMSASLFDFGLYMFHNAKQLIARGSGPYLYLPKLESRHEARLWNDVFNFAQDWLHIPRGTIRATILIETILAAFEMEEILYELKEHASGLNAGRWDYIFSTIKKLGRRHDFVLPDRSQVTMDVPFMRAYAQLLVKTCHRRGAHAMGGMSAFVPSRKDAKVNETAFAKVREDKQREVRDGFDGTWVAHPDLVPVAKAVFDAALKDQPHQKDRLRLSVRVSPSQLLDVDIPGSSVTVSGITNNIDVALQYIESWLRGVGAAAIYNLMEDAATAEISRAQLWQWINGGVKTDTGVPVTKELYFLIRDELLQRLSQTPGNRFAEAASLLDQLVLSTEFVEFLTPDAYAILCGD